MKVWLASIKSLMTRILGRLLHLALVSIRMIHQFWKFKVIPFLIGQKLLSEKYWDHLTVMAHDFKDAEDSLASFHLRNEQYHGYINLLPVTGHDDQVVLDYGCGPGHDLVGFAHYSNPARLIGCDVSSMALSIADERLSMHNANLELVQISERDTGLPFEDHSIDYIHSSGVLHHTPDPVRVLREFRRILRPDGHCRVMVYNYNSIWVHLYVAYQNQLLNGKYSGFPVKEAFQKTADGKYCPISQVWTPLEFINLSQSVGFTSHFVGSAISKHEMDLLPKLQSPLGEPNLRDESRKFLEGLAFDIQGVPVHEGHVAGIDAVFDLVNS